mmetsp:Transcript_5440/g.16174  ORF Transcript_5440/g.16174 Transcript_5440/m.16174 type:complete len:339 (+) Transcript_5440:80-1096(+)
MFPLSVVYALVAIIPFTLAVREEGDLDGELSAHESSGQSADTHICCVMFTKDGEHTKASTQVYNNRFQGEISKCDLTYITSGACRNHGQCKKECDEKIEMSVRYHRVMDVALVRQEAQERQEVQLIKANEEKRGNQTLRDLDAAYKRELEAAEQAVAAAQAAVDRAEGEQRTMQQELEELKERLAAAPEKIQKLTAIYNETRDTFYQAKQTALDNYERGKATAETATQQASEKADAIMQALEERVANRTEKAKFMKDALVPEACVDGDQKSGGKFGIKDCCCSINGIPMLVDAHFADWGACLAAQKYDKKLLSFRCSLYQECPRCREQICSTGVCPQE